MPATTGNPFFAKRLASIIPAVAYTAQSVTMPQPPKDSQPNVIKSVIAPMATKPPK